MHRMSYLRLDSLWPQEGERQCGGEERFGNGSESNPSLGGVYQRPGVLTSFFTVDVFQVTRSEKADNPWVLLFPPGLYNHHVQD